MKTIEKHEPLRPDPTRSGRGQQVLNREKWDDGLKEISQRSTHPWLDGSQRFLFGMHKGETVSDVADSDPGYLQWITEEVKDCPDDDMVVFLEYVE